MPERHSAKTVEEVLRAGGNAVDASIAAAFVLAVTLPEAGNIGGGGFMLARMDKENHFLDYREKAPLKAYRNMYLDEEGNPIEKSSLVGIRAAGVPGTVAGMWEVHQEFATMSWSELLAPAIKYAREGFVVHEKTAASIPATIEWFGGKVNFADYFGDLAKAENFKQPVLAETLERIAKSGPKDFYQGRTAKMIVAQSEQDGGLITQADLSEYQAVWRAPIEANWRDYQVITAPPPSSGGFAIVQLLKMKELLDAEFADLEVNTPQYIHLVAEMEKRVFADRAEYFGDPDFVDVPLAELISDAYIKKRTSEVNTRSISQISDAQPGLESPNTTHFSIVDKWGNAVANTYTINWEYGSGVVVEGAGFILNNEMDDFSVKPGVGNIYGVVGGTANEIQGGKRMLSSMSPTLLINEDEVELVLGTPGGSTIFTTVFQAIVNVVDYDMPPETVVGMSRFHHQLLPPDLITTSVSKPLPQRTIKELNSMGYRVEPHAWEYGDLQLIHRTYNESRPASDPRGIGVSGVVR
ncbi:MAG: gamma-glutamyltransferase [Pseudomonadota bacterium]